VGAPLGVALTGHFLPLDAVRRLTQRADELGYSVLIVDGDAGVLPRRRDAPIYATSALSSVALHATQRASVGAIRIPTFWNVAHLARDLATLQELSGGRALGFFGVGAERHESRFGFERRSPGQRVRLLEETLGTVRCLLAGEEVTWRGEFVELEHAFIARPSWPVPIVVAAGRPQALAVAERHADVLDANVPPLPERLGAVRERLARELEIWVWVFCRPGALLETAVKDYRRRCPWFSDVPEAALDEALLWGEPARCRDRLAEMRARLAVDMPVLDLTGLDEAASAHALEVFAPANPGDLS
jgi:alkanesulfonate monooxygenase SsuD/methylene tetrahydromethanopterin reductase-like flavin-dependent oxidoreductase (luciferase family)